jgi:hypothetical protein
MWQVMGFMSVKGLDYRCGFDLRHSGKKNEFRIFGSKALIFVGTTIGT